MNARGEQHGRAKLTTWDVRCIRVLLEDPERPSIRRISRAFGISPRTVRGILVGRIWGWLE